MTTRQPTIADAINWDHAAEFSYASHVTEGIDYVCLFRSTALTIKAYFFDQGSDDSIVIPHNHRYDFETRVIVGSLREVRYWEVPDYLSGSRYAERFNRYHYECIIDGGGGFTFDREVELSVMSDELYNFGDVYSNRAHIDTHTLRAVRPGTIALLTQYADRGPVTSVAYGHAIPDTSNVYRKMEPAELRRRVDQLQEAMRP